MVAQNVSSAIESTGLALSAVALAADVTDSAMLDRLNGDVEFSFAELVHIGGFLHVAPESFFVGVAA